MYREGLKGLSKGFKQMYTNPDYYNPVYSVPQTWQLDVFSYFITLLVLTEVLYKLPNVGHIIKLTGFKRCTKHTHNSCKQCGSHYKTDWIQTMQKTNTK